jgi:KDO2-lipid IV(A) lauroyltransferase
MAEFIVGDSLRKLARRKPYLQQILWRLDYALVWSLISLFRLLPIDTASRLGARVGRWIGPRMRRKHAIYRENLALAFPQLDESELDSLVLRAWGQAGRVLAEYPHLDAILKHPERLEIDIREPIATYSNPDQPCVIVTAHHNNWEVVCSAMAKLGIPNASLYSPPTNPFLDQLLARKRRALNCELIPRDNSARPLMRALRSGRTAAMVMDRRVDEGRAIRFFGRDKISTLLPAKLALKYHCELVPVQVVRIKDASYRVIFHKPLHPGDVDASEDSQAQDLVQQAHRLFEGWIRAEPEGWFCSKRLWPKSKLNQSGNAAKTAEVNKHAA